jgi:hypothetical protein
MQLWCLSTAGRSTYRLHRALTDSSKGLGLAVITSDGGYAEVGHMQRGGLETDSGGRDKDLASAHLSGDVQRVWTNTDASLPSYRGKD